ncbi:PucR family transcriptional regulator ligand-binding domain-containing protein, partial [Streptomyces prunicolor]|uniref:PucR family transcriptional regulator ligand-binding domain-containing protein n=1 Tax=Streptomyces prunicolor TaxID=67348 RepID=UPI0033C14113
MPFLTVADVLRLPVIAAGLPRVVAGEEQLGRTVRWVHVTELLDDFLLVTTGAMCTVEIDVESRRGRRVVPRPFPPEDP